MKVTVLSYIHKSTKRGGFATPSVTLFQLAHINFAIHSLVLDEEGEVHHIVFVVEK